MKRVIILCSMLGMMAACSSAEKKEAMEATAPEAPVATEATATESKKESTGSDSRTVCKLDKDERIIDVRKTASGGCELFYTKFGEEKSVATSGFGTQYCEEVKDRIQSNLAKAGFSCQ